MEGCLFTAGASRVCPDFHRIGLLSILSILSYLISFLVPYASCSIWNEWKAQRFSVNYASRCAIGLVINVFCGIVPCIDFAFSYLLNFAHFPAFYLGYSTMRGITAGFCEEQTAMDNEIMNFHDKSGRTCIQEICTWTRRGDWLPISELIWLPPGCEQCWE